MIAETAFGQNSDGRYWWFVVIVDNPNQDAALGSAFEGVKVEAVDADGVILQTSGASGPFLPGRSAVTGTLYDVGSSAITELNVIGPDPSTSATLAPGEIETFAFDSVESVSNEWSTTISGIVSGTFTDELAQFRVVIIGRDASGAIQGGDSTYVDRLPVGGKVRFQIDSYEPYPAGTTYEVFGNFG